MPSRSKTKTKARSKSKVEPKSKRKGADVTERLLQSARELGVKSFVVMPLDEIQLGFKLAKRPRARVLPELLVLAGDPNMHARRIALSALRHMRAWDDPAVLDLFIHALVDAEGWVRYDAAWALGESETSDPRALAGLQELARWAEDAPPLSDGAKQAYAQAKESLARYRGATKP